MVQQGNVSCRMLHAGNAQIWTRGVDCGQEKFTVSRNCSHIHESHISFHQCVRYEFSVLYHSTPVTDMRLSHCIVSSGSRKHIKVNHHAFLPLFIEPSSTHSTSNTSFLPYPTSQTWSHPIAPYNPSTHQSTPWKYVRMPM